MSSRDRVGRLRGLQVECARLRKAGDEREADELIAKAYADLRMAWERAVEDALLRGVVSRFLEGVQTKRLRQVEVRDEDWAAIDAGMSKCSKFAAHDGAPAANVAAPPPEALAADINEFDAWRASIEQRAKETQKRRKGPSAGER